MDTIKKWFLGLIELLTSQSGDGDTDPAGTATITTPVEGGDDDSNEGGGDDPEGGGREGFIPRDRFDEVNAKAQKLEKLKELGILNEDENGEVHVNQEVINPTKPESKGQVTPQDFMFAKSEVDEASWPLVEKINKGFQYYENLARNMAFHLESLQSENGILREHPEYLQKDGELRKKAQDIMKNDAEFKNTYKNHPQAGYWAVKRAAALLAGTKPPKEPKTPKKSTASNFIVPKSDAGATSATRVPIGNLTDDQLDALERKEHDRLNKK